MTLSLTANAFDAHFKAVKTFAGRDEQGVAIFATEADVGSPILCYGDVLDLFTGLIEHGDALTGQIDVALVVYGHAIGTEFAEQLFVGDCSIVLDLVRVGFFGVDVGDVKDLAIGRPDNSVRLCQVSSYLHQFFVRGIEVEDGMAVLLNGAALPVITLIIGIGEIHAAIGSYPDIVRTVEQFAAIISNDNGGFTGRADAPQSILFIGAGPQITMRIETETVGASTRLQEGGQLAIHTPFHDAVVRLIGEVDISMGVTGGSFRKSETA